MKLGNYKLFRNIDYLVTLTSVIYDNMFTLLEPCEKNYNGKGYYIDAVNNFKKMLEREKHIYENLIQYDNTYEIYNEIRDKIKHEYNDDLERSYLMINRISNNFMSYDMNCVEDDSNLALGAHEYSVPFKIDFMQKIHKHPKFKNGINHYKYVMGFKYPSLLKLLMRYNFDIDKLPCLMPIMRLFNSDDKTIKSFEYNYAQETIEEFLEYSARNELNHDLINLFYEEFLGSINSLSDEDVIELYFDYSDYLPFSGSDNNPIAKIAKAEVLDKLKEGLEDQILYEESLNVINSDNLKIMAKLLDLNEQISKILSVLWKLEDNGYKDSDKYQEGCQVLFRLCGWEHDVFSHLSIQDCEEIAEVMHIAESYFDFKESFGKENNPYNIDIKSQRLRFRNLISNEVNDVFIYSNLAMPRYIRQKFNLECLKAQEDNYNNKEIYYKDKYNTLMAKSLITGDFALAGGNYDNLVNIDENSYRKLFGMSLDDYNNDKDFVLSPYALNYADAMKKNNIRLSEYKNLKTALLLTLKNMSSDARKKVMRKIRNNNKDNDGKK